MKTKITGIIIAVILAAASVLHADPAGDGMSDGMGMGRHRHGRMHNKNIFSDIDYLKNTLKFSDEQISKIEKINSAHKEEMSKLRAQILPKKNDLRNLILDKNINYDKIRAKLKEISEIDIEIRVLFIKHRIDIENIMTQEQKKLLKKGRTGRKDI